MTLADVLFLMVVFYIGWTFGKAYQRVVIRETLKQLAKNQSTTTVTELIDGREEEKMEIILLQSEEIDNTILIYDVLTNEFICQGKTLEEAAQKFYERNQNVVGALVHNDNELLFKNGKVSTVNDLK
jgi:fatty acid-binding protein DegV